jgi:hypothetical protein
VVLGRQTGTTPALYVLGQLAHRLLRDFDAFAPVNRSLSRVDGREDFRAAPLALDPQGQGLLDCVLVAFKPPALDGAADKILLLGCQGYSHMIERSIAG